MASMETTPVQTCSTIFLLFAAITLLGVQAGRVIPNDFTFANQPRIPIDRESLGKPFPKGTTRFESEPINVGESKFWASTWNTQDAGRPRGGVTNEYNYAKEDTYKPSYEFFTPEMLARIKAFNDAEQAKFVREMQNYEAKPQTTPTTSGSNEYPKMLSDGTELLWVTGPVKTSLEELARLDALMGKPKSTAALPGSQRNEVQGSTDVHMFHPDSSNWEDGPFGTKHRPGTEHSLEYVGFEQPDGTKVPQSVNINP